MEQIAFLLWNQIIYWKDIILLLSTLTAALMFLSLCCFCHRSFSRSLLILSFSIFLSLLFARLIHWYCCAELYDGFLLAMTDFSSGGFALAGCFVGCCLAALLGRILSSQENLPEILDCMCLAGSLGIALGRLSSFFDVSDRGQMITSMRTMPWVYPVVNAVSGHTEYRLATFLLQAMMAGFLFLVLTAIYLRRPRHLRDGDIALLFLLLYSASQIVLDSTRYDSIYFHFNRFISIVQVLCGLTLVTVILIFAARMVRNRGFRLWHVILWIMIAGLLGCCGYMEYYVQRHGNQALFSYSIMISCLLLTCGITLYLYCASNSIPQKKERQ